MKKRLLISTTLLGFIAAGSIASSAAPGAEPGAPAKRVTAGQLIYEAGTDVVTPVDPTDPTKPVDPVDPIDPTKPVEPGTSGPLSLDYASALNFGKQKIVSTDQIYFAAPQKVRDLGTPLGDASTVEKPLYVQVTDNRGTLKGWTLSIAQPAQFKTETSQKELEGAAITFKNGQLETAMDSPKPTDLTPNHTLVPGAGAQKLMAAKEGQAAGTWLFRFGAADLSDMKESVELSVPGKSTKLAEKYTTTLEWTLSTVPGQ